MKVTYLFENDDEYDRKIFENAQKYHTTLLDIYQTLRTHLKYDHGDPEEVLDQINDLVMESRVMEVE